jgi:uncharacterized protein (DUF302 family)
MAPPRVDVLAAFGGEPFPLLFARLNITNVTCRITGSQAAVTLRGVTVEQQGHIWSDMHPSGEYGYSVAVEEGYDEAVVRSRLALRAEGFSIITEADVGHVLDPDGGRGRQYLIMSAWAAAIPARRVGADVEVGVHLPCNFVVQETGSSALVAVLDPAEGLEGAGEAEVRAAADAREAIGRVLARISSDPGT